MEIIDSCNRRDIDSYGESIDDSPIVKAPTSIPVAGTRESARLEERSVCRLSLMRNAQAYDCERLGYRFVKRCFDIVFSAAVITVAFVPSLVLCAAIAIESPGCRCTAKSAWVASARTASLASSPCGSSGVW